MKPSRKSRRKKMNPSKDAKSARRLGASSTLEDLLGEKAMQPTIDSYLTSTVFRLHRKPISEFEVEDLRIVIGQGIGLPFLLPKALEVLEQDPLAAGDFYPGDLLCAVIARLEVGDIGTQQVVRIHKIVTSALRRPSDLIPDVLELLTRLHGAQKKPESR